MKTGLPSLTAMATELERRNAAKRDFIADTRQVELVPQATAHGIEPRLALHLGSGAPLQLSEGAIFREQALSHYKIPRDYADRVRSAHPQLYLNTLNTFFREEPARRMVRVLDNNARAFLSDRFRPLDNFDLANAVLPELMALPDLRIESTEFTERRFYLKAVFPRIEMEVKKGDVVQIGIAIANSEVGASSLSVQPLVFRLVCLNGMIANDYGQKRYHVGKRASDDEAAYELYTDKTKRLEDAAFFAKVRDTVKGVLTRDVLGKLVQKMRDATEQKLNTTDLPAIVEVTAEKFGYNEATKGGILRHLIEGGDLTRYGLLNAITRQSQDETDYETATRMESDGARILELPQTDWRAIAEAA